MILFNFIVLFCYTLSTVRAFGTDLPALQTIFSFFGGGDLFKKTKNKDIDSMTPEELGISRGQCDYLYEVLAYITGRDEIECARDEYHIQHLLPTRLEEPVRKPPIMVKCVQPEPTDNITMVQTNSLLMMESVKDIVSLLKPIGNATKRHEPGSCVLVLFYTETSFGCAQVAPYANALPRLFPTLRIAAIDAFQFTSFNTEFGIVGLPTLLLFHQGRPIVKFYSDVGTFAAFVTRHTGIKPIELPTTNSGDDIIDGPLPLKPVEKPDYILALAWIFVLICAGNFFSKSRWYQQIVEMVKRNWRESGAQLEPN